MTMSKKYWRGLPELNNSKEFQAQHQNEFPEALPMDEFLASESASSSNTSRRDFLKIMGFSTAAVALASCETPVNKSIPYVVKPEEITPGVANFYATTFYDGYDFANILVKTREARPIKIESNTSIDIPFSATNARIQASVLSLYDGARLRGPMQKGQEITWTVADQYVKKALAQPGVRLLTGSIISPSIKRAISELVQNNPQVKHVVYDAVSYSAMLSANATMFGVSALPNYDFSKAEFVIGISCDFLGNWISGKDFARQYAQLRKVSKAHPKMSRHIQIESVMSLTGANADYRYMAKPSEMAHVVVALHNAIAKILGKAELPHTPSISNKSLSQAIQKYAKTLTDLKGKSLIVCGLNDTGMQCTVNAINQMLDNYGYTIDIKNNPVKLFQGIDTDFISLVEEIKQGKVNTLITYQCNPVYTAPQHLDFAGALKKVNYKISTSLYNDETAMSCDLVCPDQHFLESWGDAQPNAVAYTLIQPCITPVFAKPRHEGTRQFLSSILVWNSAATTDARDYIKSTYNALNQEIAFEQALHDGGLILNPALSTTTESIKTVILKTSKTSEKEPTESLSTTNWQDVVPITLNASASGLELITYQKAGIGNGNQSNNPWLMEMPDPISKVTWDNYITMNPDDVKKMGLHEMLRQDIDGSIVTLTSNGKSVEVPVYPQPGQAPGSVGLALGYGRKAESLKVAFGVGVNAFAFQTQTGTTIQNWTSGVTIKDTGKTHAFAATQIQHTIMGREEYLLREVSLNEFKTKEKSEWNPAVEITVHGGGKKHVSEVDLWAAHPRPGHKWGLSIDMNLCIGCSACVIACTAENNVAVVGKSEVRKTRDMQWLRIDRYYSSDMNTEKGKTQGLGSKQMYIEMENPSSNPKVTFQPMMCQHCNHAPCETVCPVLATSHSTEGLNMMTYNRCIGTRYCANNCPFKVRRFNWFNYIGNSDFAEFNPAQQELGRMVLNPDVVVRGRGVMEKCSMCQQRLQAGKLEAKKAGTALKDGAIQTACQGACPTQAIVFGDLNDKDSQITKEQADERSYYLLEDVGIKPSNTYKVKVRNQDEPLLSSHTPKATNHSKTEHHS